MTIDVKAKVMSVVTGGLGVIAALMLAAPATADPEITVAPPVPPPTQEGAVQAAAETPPVLTDGVQHLSSPENLPPGTSDNPVGRDESRSLEYLRDLWQAVQTQEVSGRDAVLLLTQRPMNPDAAPPPGLPAGPQQPLPALVTP